MPHSVLAPMLAILLLGLLGGCANQGGDQLQLGGVSGTASQGATTSGNPLATKVLATLAVERITGKRASFAAAERPAKQRSMLVAAN